MLIQPAGTQIWVVWRPVRCSCQLSHLRSGVKAEDGQFLQSRGSPFYVTPVEMFVAGIKIFDRWKMCLIAWSFPSETLDRLIFSGSKVKLQPCVLDHLIVAFWRSPWSLDWLSERALIAWFLILVVITLKKAHIHVSHYPLPVHRLQQKILCHLINYVELVSSLIQIQPENWPLLLCQSSSGSVW